MVGRIIQGKIIPSFRRQLPRQTWFRESTLDQTSELGAGVVFLKTSPPAICGVYYIACSCVGPSQAYISRSRGGSSTQTSGVQDHPSRANVSWCVDSTFADSLQQPCFARNQGNTASQRRLLVKPRVSAYTKKCIPPQKMAAVKKEIH